LAGFLVQFLPSPTHLVYLVLLAIFVVQLVGVLLMPETSETTPGALASLRPELSMPAGVRGPMLAAFPALVAVWSLAGLYASLGPTLVHILSGSSSYVLGALSLTVLAATGALTTYLARDVEPRRVMVAGMLTLLVGVGLTVLAVQVTSTAGFFIGTAVAGAGFGGGFQGALRTVVPLAAPHQRAGVLSSLYVVSYLALGAPAVGGGFLVDHVGVLTTARDYAAVVMVLAAGALVATLAHARRSMVRARRDVRHSFAGCGQPCAD
jgi:predicted MFS family arabinose efflux permease